MSRAGRRPNCCAPTEREPNGVTFGPYKHLAPLGRNPTASTCCTSKLNSRMDKWKRSFRSEMASLPYLFRRGIRNNSVVG